MGDGFRWSQRTGVNALLLLISPIYILSKRGRSVSARKTSASTENAKLSFESPRLPRSTIDLKLGFVSPTQHLTTLVTHQPRVHLDVSLLRVVVAQPTRHPTGTKDPPMHARRCLPHHSRRLHGSHIHTHSPSVAIRLVLHGRG